MEKRFAPPKATEAPILNVTWGIVDNGTAPPLLSWTAPVKEAVQISAHITGQKREVRCRQESGHAFLPYLPVPWHLFLCDTTYA